MTECCIAKEPDKIPLGDLLAIDSFNAEKMSAEQASSAEVQLVKLTDEGHEGHGGHENGHGGGHGEYDDGHGGGHEASHGAGHGNGEAHGHGHIESRHDTDVKSMVLELEGSCLDLGKFNDWLGEIIAEQSVDLYRY